MNISATSMRISAACAAGAVALAAAPAKAEQSERSRYYGAVRATLENGDANEFIFDNGYGAVAALGLNLGEKWRTEISVSRRGADIIGVPPIEAEGYFRTWAWLFNVYYHPIGRDRRISPYLALGGGFNHVSTEAVSTETHPDLVGLGFLRQRYVEKAWQGKLGVATRLTPRLSLDIATAYFVSDDHDVKANFPNNDIVEANYRTYSLLVGLRRNF